MSPKIPSCRLFWLIGFFVLAGATPGLRAADGRMVVSQESIRPVPQGADIGPNDPRRPYIKRATLQPAEMAEEMQFEVALKMRNFAELQARIARNEIIPFAEMAARYYPSQADYDAVDAWLRGQGFKIVRKDDNHLAIFASGSVDAIQRAMKVSFARVALEGKEYTSAVTGPGIPVGIAPLLVGINGLQPHLQKHLHLAKPANPHAGVRQPYTPRLLSPAAAGAQDVIVSSTNGTGEPYTPAQILRAYGANGLVANGSGQTIAIVMSTFPSASDLTTFWSAMGVAQSGSNISYTQVVSGSLPTDTDDLTEITLDTEWTSSIAPGAKIRIYATTSLSDTNLDTAYQQVYSDVTAHPEYNIHEMTMSYGAAELTSSASQERTDDQYFANLVSAGVTVFASSGDTGDDPDGVTVENPASDPNVTGVGGTSLTLTSGSAINTEVVWNNSPGATGGGTSVVFSRPIWQVGAGLPAGSTRCVPDVAAPADPDEGAYIYITLPNSSGSFEPIGGTSWSSPTWAGFCALINQTRANAGLKPVGLLGPKIYLLIGTNNFHDITSGSNGSPGGSGTGYPAGPGYDLCTGIGSPNMQNLVPSLVGLQTSPSVTTLTPSLNGTFAVVGSATTASYQWQRMPIGSGSWSNIPAGGTYAGVTGSSLVINGLTAAMSGDQFQCVVTIGAGQITTSPPSVLVVDNQLVVTTLAGKAGATGTANGMGTSARFYYPSLPGIDGSGNIYVPDNDGDSIRKVTPAGAVTTPYGVPEKTGTTNGVGNSAKFNTPNAVAVDSAGNIYVADYGNDTIRKINTSGSVSTFAGAPGQTGTTNGVSALFNLPLGVAVDGSGNVYVADSGNNTIRKITPSGSASTVAGNSGTAGWQDGTGTAALFNYPVAIAVDASGNMYVADYNNYVVRKITPAGVVSTPYGKAGVVGTLDGIGNGALFNSPIGVALDGVGNLYVADCEIPPSLSSTLTGNNILRRINTAGVVSTIAGTPYITGTGNGTGPAAQFDSLQGVIVNSSGVIYLGDTFNQTIRVGGLAPLITTEEGTQTVTTGQSATFSVSAAGSGSFTYQWYFSGAAISGATGSSYTIPSASGSNAGSYDVMVTDPYGTSTSSTYTLTVNTPIPDLSYWMLAGLAMLLLISASAFLSPPQMKTDPTQP